MGAASGHRTRYRALAACTLLFALLTGADPSLPATGTSLPATGTSLPATGTSGTKAVPWRQSVTTHLTDAARQVEAFLDVTWRRFSSHLGLQQPRQIMAYRGYGNGEHLWVLGRLLANPPYAGPADDDGWWDNLKETYARWNSHEIPNAPVRLTYAGRTVEVQTDTEGYYHARLDADAGHPDTGAVLAEYPPSGRLAATHWVLVPDPRAELLIISDLDDTVIFTDITHLLQAAQLTFLHNARTRKPLAGAGSLYRALARGRHDEPVNPVFYVSNSPWNLYDLLRDFLDLNELPRGPLLLRDAGFPDDGQRGEHKLDAIRALLTRFPELPAVLIGDSGQHDAQFYAQISEEFPRRIRAVYIRDVDPDRDSTLDRRVDDIIDAGARRGIPFLRVRDSAAVAAHAADIGLLPSASLPGINVDVVVDRQRDTAAEALISPDAESR